jgi:2-polyprenyl-6-hydroxyphenyl methylase/3-demethylubiquinone-9 3-methyltransferase
MTLWGDNRVAALETTRGVYVEGAAGAREYHELFRRTFGPLVAIYASMADRTDRTAALDRDLLQFVARWNRGNEGGPVEIPYEYLLVVARARGA